MTRPEEQDQSVIERPLAEILSEKYLSYSLSTIMSRSLPDVRDGLKPVHRRLLFAMSQLRLDPSMAPKKCARVVGDVIGKFHPHGDQSVYDALVRLAQDFAVRYPLVDGQGNFGNIDGDNAAAMRYTEARLTEVAQALLEGIKEDSVDFRETYDGEGAEPIVLPAAFPNLLANGATGIAVGMATSIPPHNVGELCAALTHLIENKTATVEDIVKFIPAPDFPTGGILVESPESIMESYKTGRGGFRMRAKWHKEDLKQGLYQIVVTEIPYQVQKSKLVEKIADLITSKKIPILDDVRDESAEDIRLVLMPKNRNVEAEILMEALFRNSELETRFSLNMNVLDGGTKPRVMDLKEVLVAFLNHRRDVLLRRSNYRLGKINERLEILEGYLIAYLNIDEVIKIIREEDDAKTVMMARFNLTDNQAEAILNMRLRALRKLEEFEIRTEHKGLSEEKEQLELLLSSDARQWTMIKKQIQVIGEKFGDDRRTILGEAPSLEIVPMDAMIEREPITVVCSAKGWIKAMKGHGINPDDIKYKEGDRARFVLTAETTDKILLFSTDGRFFTIGGDKMPPGRGFGEPVRLMMDLPNEVDIVDVMVFKPNQRIIVASDSGYGFIVKSDDILAQTRNGKQVLNLSSGAEACKAYIIPEGHDTVVTIGDNRKMLAFAMTELPEMTRGKGVILQKFKDGGLSDLTTATLAEGLLWQSGARTMTTPDLTPWVGKRAASGRLPPNGFSRNNKFS